MKRINLLFLKKKGNKVLTFIIRMLAASLFSSTTKPILHNYSMGAHGICFISFRFFFITVT